MYFFKILLLWAILVIFSGCAGRNMLVEFNGDFRDIVLESKNKVFPAVVYIHALTADLESGRDIMLPVRGSGVIISADGYVLTNFHVADKAKNIRCQLNNSAAFDAELIGFDKDVDIALLKLNLPENAEPLPFAKISGAGVQEGDFVMAMGAPWGMNRSVSIGIISCRSRYLDDKSEYSTWYQTDAAISPGNSGGPLVNTAGEVVGINTLGTFYGGDIAFAIPSQTILDLIPRLKEYKEANWAWTGLELQPLENFDQNIYFDFDQGVIVSGTAHDSPAEQADIRPKDLITKVNGEPVMVKTAEDMPDFRRKLGLLPFDKPVEFTIERGDKTLEISVVPIAKGKVEGKELVLKRWGITVKTINRFDNPNLFYQKNEGVYVFGIDYDGNSANSGLRKNDIILSVAGSPVNTLEDLEECYEKALSGGGISSKVLFNIQRNNLKRQMVIEFSRDNDKE